MTGNFNHHHIQLTSSYITACIIMHYASCISQPGQASAKMASILATTSMECTPRTAKKRWIPIMMMMMMMTKKISYKINRMYTKNSRKDEEINFISDDDDEKDNFGSE